MGRVAQGGWVEAAQEMDRVRTSAREAGAHDPVASVVADLGVTRQSARRLLAAYDVVSSDLGRMRVVASLGSVEAWRLLSEVDPVEAGRIREQVLTGAMPLSAVKDVLEAARSARAVPAEVASMTMDEVVDAVRRATGCDLPLHDAKGLAEEIGVDLEHSLVEEDGTDGLPRFEPFWALVVSPRLPLSRCHGVSQAAFRQTIMSAVSMYRIVVVACTSGEERSGLVRDLAQCRWRPGTPTFVTLGDW